MTPYENRKPRYVREWYLRLKAKLKAKRRELEEKEIKKKMKEQMVINASKTVKGSKMTPKKDYGEFSAERSQEDSLEGEGHEQSDYEDKLIEQMDFSDEEEEEGGGITIKNIAQYNDPPP
jgi:hypothetical protein